MLQALARNRRLDDRSARFNVDTRCVYLAGHSNGAFMAYRYGSVPAVAAERERSGYP